MPMVDVCKFGLGFEALLEGEAALYRRRLRRRRMERAGDYTTGKPYRFTVLHYRRVQTGQD